ncbi:hypothetical protein F5B22DRAFT_454949 [Xylaria bambusicola]|uniref:uncharacterized protein n=1 Tax=Xylaria bambusicola TaxID=326684 RepID=UPI00200802FE|nr:uncharacterized protein F5B22DRAFT_454949 [Xylaria bambusicola]KAI0506294.1 hypothetical protein F5B22DRAFT_454949 [Xylaria bambusicola]
MDPLSITASVIAVAGLATQSAKAIYKVIDGLVEAPQAINHSKTLITGTQHALDTLTGALQTNQDMQARFGPVLQSTNLYETLASTQDLCERFNTTITMHTSHSTESRFSTRDRFQLSLKESHIVRFNAELAACQRTVSLVVESITLIVSHRTSNDVQQLSVRFQAQEQALSTLAAELSKKPMTLEGDNPVQSTMGGNEQASLQLFAILLKTCEAAFRATQAKRTGQTFGDMQVDQSVAMQGIVGEAQRRVDQSFGKLSVQNNSKAFQGQMDANSFSCMFG